MEGMSYGRYVACGMPNLARFKRRADDGEFDHKPVRARSRKGILAAVAAQDKPDEPEKPKRPVPRPERLIKAGKCEGCGVELPPEKRAGPPRKLCKTCADDRRRERRRKAAAAFKERQRTAKAKTRTAGWNKKG